MRHYHYTIDSDGRLFHEGSEITDSSVLKFFMRRMEEGDDGDYQVLCQGEINHIQPDDVAYVIQDIHIHPDSIDLLFPGQFKQQLDPSTLFVGNENVLYCRIRDGQFTARFKRAPYMELAKMIEFDDNKKVYQFVLNGVCYPIG